VSKGNWLWIYASAVFTIYNIRSQYLEENKTDIEFVKTANRLFNIEGDDVPSLTRLYWSNILLVLY
jgi:hypothetical protein